MSLFPVTSMLCMYVHAFLHVGTHVCGGQNLMSGALPTLLVLVRT